MVSNRKAHGGWQLGGFSFYPRRRRGSPIRCRRGLEAERSIGCKGVNGGAAQLRPPTRYRNAAAAAKKSAVAP